MSIDELNTCFKKITELEKALEGHGENIKELAQQRDKIAELEKERNDYKRFNMDRYHLMHSVADELRDYYQEEYEYLPKLVYDEIIKKLRGEE